MNSVLHRLFRHMVWHTETVAIKSSCLQVSLSFRALSLEIFPAHLAYGSCGAARTLVFEATPVNTVPGNQNPVSCGQGTGPFKTAACCFLAFWLRSSEDFSLQQSPEGESSCLVTMWKVALEHCSQSVYLSSTGFHKKTISNIQWVIK
jgi:hypothetical protein